MKFGVIQFPGSNCDQDAFYVVDSILKQDAEYVWHEETVLKDMDCVILPGGFSYGDYLRTGAIARFSPVMKAVAAFAESGGLVVGICNGFQILLEAGLLPGAMVKNKGARFICDWTWLKVENLDTPFTRLYRPGDVIKVPIAHSDGCYYAPPKVLEKLNEKNRVVFRYTDPRGNRNDDYNLNGSADAIAGIVNEGGNVLGMMPHPERACETVLGSDEGRRFFFSIVKYWDEKHPKPVEPLVKTSPFNR